MKKNIGLFNDSFPPVMDGVAICVENYARCMQKQVGGISVITPENKGVSYDDKEYEVLSYASVPVPFRHPYVTGVAEVDPAFLSRILRREYKIVHAHCPFTSGLAASRVAKHQHIPMVATFHSKYREDFARVLQNDRLVDIVIKYIVGFYESADEVWVPQESVKEVLYSYGYKGNIEVVQNGCDLGSGYSADYCRQARSALGLRDGDFALLFVGQHIWEKNLRLVIESLDRIKDLDFKMFFVGKGYASEEMKAMVSSLGLDDKVSFEGVVTDREKLKQYYAASDLFLFPSLYDTDGIVVREAAAFNTPSIMLKEASASGMLQNEKTGFLVEGTLDAFEAELRRLYADREAVLKVGQAAGGSIVRSWEDIASEVIDRYNSLIARQHFVSKM